MFSPSLVEKNLPNLSHTPSDMAVCVCVCGLLTSLRASGKTSEHSSKQQNTDEDKTVLFWSMCSPQRGMLDVCVCERERQRHKTGHKDKKQATTSFKAICCHQVKYLSLIGALLKAR